MTPFLRWLLPRNLLPRVDMNLLVVILSRGKGIGSSDQHGDAAIAIAGVVHGDIALVGVAFEMRSGTIVVSVSSG